MPHLLLLAALAVGGCASAGAPATSPDHPASASAAAAPADTERVAFAPAAEPVLPPALRPSVASPSGMAPMAGMDHGGAHPAAHGAAAPAAPTAAAAIPGLTATLDAYLTVHDALAGDRFADAAAQAASLETALAALTATPPATDAHLWHTHADDLAAVRTHLAALSGAADIAAARVAFGTMSVPFIRLVQATGVPAGYDLALMRCGMARGVPEGGVWVQRAGETANPFFGAAMLRCGSRTGAVAAPGAPVGQR